MAEVPPVYVQFKGDTTDLNVAIGQAKKGLTGFAAETKVAQTSVKSLGVAQIALGGIIANVATQAAASAKQFAMSFIGDYQHIAGEVRTLSKVMDGTPEQLSTIRYAANRFGVDVSQLAQSTRLLSRNLAANNKVAQALGISYRDSNGNMLPTIEILGNLADKYQSMPSKIAANAFAMQAFGRSGGNMAPLLALGSEGIKKLGLDAEELGMIMSGKDLEAVKEYGMAQKDLKEAIEGVKVTIGRDLLPIVSDAAVKLNETLLPALKLIASAFTNSGIAGGVRQTQDSLQEFILGLDGAKQAAYQLFLVFVSFKTAQGILAAYPIIIAAITTATKKASLAMKIYNTEVAMGAGKMKAFGIAARGALIATGVGALIVALTIVIEMLINAYMTSETFRTKVNNAFESVARAAVKVVNGIIKIINAFNRLTGLKELGMISLGGGDSAGTANDREGRKGIYVGDSVSGAGVYGGGGGGGGGKKSSKAAARKEAIKNMKENLKGFMSEFSSAAAQAADTTVKPEIAPELRRMQEVAKEYMAEASANLSSANALEKKTKKTKQHAAAVKLLAEAQANYNKIASYSAQVAQQVADAEAKAAAEAAAALAAEAAAQAHLAYVANLEADATARATEEQNRMAAALNRSLAASNSWLASQTRRAGVSESNLGGFIEVPVVIDGQVVFRATQKYSLMNNRRNVTNGLATSGSLI